MAKVRLLANAFGRGAGGGGESDLRVLPMSSLGTIGTYRSIRQRFHSVTRDIGLSIFVGHTVV